jgi:hypothetical protein
MKKSYKFIFLISLFVVAADSLAFDPVEKVVDVFSKCLNLGYLECDKEFVGSNRGVFHFFIVIDRLERAEKDFDKFIQNIYPNDKSFFYAYLLQGKINFNINIKQNLDIDNLRKKIEVKKISSEKFYIRIKGLDPFEIVNKNDEWKVSVFNLSENNFIDSDKYPIYLLMKLKANILNYHVAYAQNYKQDKEDLLDDINEAILPLVWNSLTDKERPLLMKWLIKDPKEVIDFYINMDTDEKIQKRLKDI